MEKHILQFFSLLDSGGAENRMMDVYRCINSEKVIFDFAVLHEGKHFFDDEIFSMGSQKYVFPDPHKSIFLTYNAMVKFFRVHKEIQAVHAHVSWFNGVVLFAAKKARIPIRIAHARDSKYPDRSIKDSILCNIGKILISFSATQRIAISEEAASNIFGTRVAKKHAYLFIPNSIDQKKYSYLSLDEKKHIRNKLNISNNKMALVSVANLRKQKNHAFLLEIMYELKKMDDAFVLYLIGDGDLQNSIEKRIAELELDNDVKLLGSRADVPNILGAFDCMVFPSLFEGLGGVVLEAQLVGIPSVVSDRIPRVADVGADMVTFLSLNKSAKEWAEIIIHVSRNFSDNHERTLRAFKEKGYCIEDTASAYLKEYGFNPEEIKDIMK